MLPHYLGKFTFCNDNSVNQIDTLLLYKVLKTKKNLVFHKSLSGWAQVLQQAFNNTVSDFIFKFLNSFNSVLMDEVSKNVPKHELIFPK